jgi:hypothetical protein
MGTPDRTPYRHELPAHRNQQRKVCYLLFVICYFIRASGQNEPVPMEGIEPTRPRGHRILSPARLPVPPHRLMRRGEVLSGSNRNASGTRFQPVLDLAYCPLCMLGDERIGMFS